MNPIDPEKLSHALAGKTPTKKMSVVRGQLPAIQSAMARGLSKREIWEGLVAGGMDIGYKTFLTYLSRIEARTIIAPSTNKPAMPDQGATSQLAGTTALQGITTARTNAATKDYSKLTKEKP